MRYDIPLEEALELILARCGTVGEERIPLESALHRVLAQDITAQCSLPPFDRSPLDGYAVRGEDISGANIAKPVYLRLLEEVPAGLVPLHPLRPGCCTRVMTGAPLPVGANAVLPQEDTRIEGNAIAALAALQPWDNYARAGEDISYGEKVLAAGAVLGSGAIGTLAALGITSAEVYRRPRVAVITTGEELIPVEAPLAPGKIRNSNAYSIVAAVKEAGGEPLPHALVPDSLEAILLALHKALSQSDLVVTTGGASVGAYDLIPEAFRCLGASLLFRRVAFKPGTPVIWGEFNGVHLAGLSGNPAAALISFELLVRPLILRLGGRARWQRPRLRGLLLEDFAKKSPQRRFVRATASFSRGQCVFSLAGGQNPGVMRSILYTNTLLDVPAGTGKLIAGQDMEGILLVDTEPGLWG